MLLCFGSYATTLRICSRNATDKTVVSSLVRTIDPKERYSDKNRAASVSRIINCKADFPLNDFEASPGIHHTTGGALTSITSLLPSFEVNKLIIPFRENILILLDEDKKLLAVLALLDIISKDATTTTRHLQIFKKYMRCSPENLVLKSKIQLESFLAGIFLYTVAIGDNNSQKGRETVSLLKTEQYWEKLSQKDITFVPYVEKTETRQESIIEGCNSYLAELRNKYSSIKTLLYNDSPHPFYDFYVCNDVQRMVRIPKSSLYKYETIEGASMEKFAKVSRYIILSGTGGLGKSMMMRHILLKAIDSYTNSEVIPVFIPVKDFNTEDPYRLIYSKVAPIWPGITQDIIKNFLSEGRFLLLFDGLDEIHSSRAALFVSFLDSLVDEYPNNLFVISSRPSSNFVSFARFTVLNLQPFTKEQALKLIDSLEFRPDAPMIKEKFRHELSSSLYYSHRGFSDNPLLLTIMLMTFEQFAEVPSKMHIFYREAYTVLSQKHDASKGAYKRALSTGLTADQFSEYLAEFCSRTYRDEKYDLTDDEIDRYFRQLKIREKGNTQIEPAEFIYDVCSNLCLMYREGNAYHFTHRSFQEYFCALFFSRQKDRNLLKIGDFFEETGKHRQGDETFLMLYDMIPEKIQEYIFIPFLEKLISKCDMRDGYWTFLEILYADAEFFQGEVTYEVESDPASFIFHFIAETFGFLHSTSEIADIPNIVVFREVTFVIRDDNGDVEDEDNLPPEYKEMYGEPNEIGYIYRFDWTKIRKNNKHGVYNQLIAYIDNDDFPLKVEFIATRKLLEQLRNDIIPVGDDLFDIL